MASLSNTQYAYWDYKASRRIQNHDYLWPAVLSELKRLGGSRIRVLDAGCGSGAFCKVLHESVNCDVYGCDLSETGISLARKAIPECQFELRSVYDNLTEAFETCFNVIVSIEVIEHLYDPKTFVSRVREALSPGGTFILTTPYHGYLKNLLIAALGNCDAHYNPLNKGGHIKFWSPKTMRTLLESAGFHVERISGAGRSPWLWKSMVVVAKPIGD